ncbi:MAG: peptide chain release factor 3 [Bacteriovoracaceae bacterium]
MNTAEVNDRCTFAIISHPDAGKTTMTEKLLWFGQVIRETGMVKSKQGQYAKSDWMEMEKERGISITSSVMSFQFNQRSLHLLDTPGHKDFSEDTYRTLTAVESVLMMIDSAKGVEEQTKKLMEVCRYRDTPIVTFMNKFDRDAMDPFELIDNVEKICSIQCVPLSWPVGSGVDFKGVYDLRTKTIKLFGDGHDPQNPKLVDASDFNSKEFLDVIGEANKDQLEEDLTMISELMPQFNEEEFLAGIQTPVFFGSALYNFGVKEVIDFISNQCPGPRPREVIKSPYDDSAEKRDVEPQEKKFTGFIFKIQANMDKRHRDRIAFLRVCSGVFKRNQKIFHSRTAKDIRIATPLIFQARDREIVEEAYPGDIIGLYDSGKYQIGDTFTEGEKIQYTGIPSFAPEIFQQVTLRDPLKGKQLDKGLRQLSEEGAVQLFNRVALQEKVLGAVGMLQFEVVKFRLEDEYNVEGSYGSYALAGVRWLKFDTDKIKNEFIAKYNSVLYTDHKDRLCYGVKSPWDLKLAKEKFPDVKFYKNSDYTQLDQDFV